MKMTYFHEIIADFHSDNNEGSSKYDDIIIKKCVKTEKKFAWDSKANKYDWMMVSTYEYGIKVEGHMEVCPSCGGVGTHDRRDIDTSKLVDNMIEDGDYDGLDAYYGGQYDVVCHECHGKNVVLVPDALPKWLSEAISEYYEGMRRHNEDVNAERRALGYY